MDLFAEARNTIARHLLLTIHAPGGRPLAVFGENEAVSAHLDELAWSAHGRWVLVEYRDGVPLIHSYQRLSHLVFALSSRYPSELRSLIRHHRYWRMFPMGSSLEWPTKPLQPYIPQPLRQIA